MKVIARTDTMTKLSGFTRRKVVLSGASIATLAAGFPLAGCGGGAVVAALAPGGLASFAPFFFFTHLGVVERKIVSVSFFPDQASTGTTSGNFATSNISVDNNTYNFTGTFKERELDITVVQPLAPLANRYTGLFTDDETIVMTPVGPGRLPFTLRLDRIDPVATRFIPALTGKWTGLDANNVPWSLALQAVDPVNNTPQANPGEPTVLLTGTETLGNAPPVQLLGYASIRYLEIDITRASGKVQLTATLQSASTPPTAGQPLTTATIAFKGGGSLRKAP